MLNETFHPYGICLLRGTSFFQHLVPTDKIHFRKENDAVVI